MLLSLLVWIASSLAGPPEALVSATVLLTQGSSVCSGAVVDPTGTVLTAYHCVASGGRPKVERHDGLVAVGRVQRVDRQRDLAWVEVPALAGGPYLNLAAEPPTQGERVWTCGHPMGADLPSGFFAGTLRFSVASGEVGALGVDAVQVSIPLNPSNSGGPVVDEQGALVGVVSRRIGTQGLGFAGRVDEPERGGPMGAIGGRWGLSPVLMSDSGGARAMSAGVRLDVSFRDRVVLGGAPLLRLASADRGTVPTAEISAGLRQRFGRGTWAPRLDLLGGVQPLRDVTTFGQGTLAPVASARANLRGILFDVGYVFSEPAGVRVSVGLDWPGTIGVF